MGATWINIGEIIMWHVFQKMWTLNVYCNLWLWHQTFGWYHYFIINNYKGQLKPYVTSLMQRFCYKLSYGESKRLDLWKSNRIFYKNIFIPIDQSLCPMGCMQSIILHLWGFLCIRDAGCRSNKITVMKFQQLCCSRTYPYNPHRRNLLYNPLPSGFSKKDPQNVPPSLPSGISKIFTHSLELLLSLIEVNK